MDEAQIRREIEQRYQQLSAAVLSKSVDLFMASISPDWVGTELDGTVVSREELRIGLTSYFGGEIEWREFEIVIDRFEMQNGLAVVEFSERNVSEVTDEAGQRVRRTARGRERETFRREAAGWTCILTESLGESEIEIQPL